MGSTIVNRVTRAAAVGLVLAVAAPSAAITVEQKCAQGKNKEAGKYAYCRQKVESKFAALGDVGARDGGFAKCLTKYALKWPLFESKAFAAGGTCASVGDQDSIQSAIDAHTSEIATAISGGPFANCAADLAVCLAEPHGRPLQTGQTGCWDSSGTPIACAGTGHDGDLEPGLPRSWLDNGNGTVTDQRSGLIWEKLSDDGSIHDKDATYTWDDAFAVKIATLNAMTFGGHSDWRVPTVNEMKSLIDYSTTSPAVPAPFNTSCAPACTVLTCSCTASDVYWTSTGYHLYQAAAWVHDFSVGSTGAFGKTTPTHVRAVSGGL